MTDWSDGPPEAVRVLRERALEGVELAAAREQMERLHGWAPSTVRKRLVLLANGQRAMDWRARA